MPELVITNGALARFPTLRILAFDVGALPKMVERSPMAPTASRIIGLKQREATAHVEIKRWREVYGQMGLRPSKYHSSIEALIRRAAKGDGAWRTGIAAVDFYNAISIEHIATIGAYDLDKLGCGPVEVRPLAPETDHFNAIGGTKQFPLNSDVLGYVRGDRVMCWALNHRDSADFQLSDETTAAVFITEAITDEQFRASRKAIAAIGSAAEASNLGPSFPVLYDSETPKGRFYS